MYKVEQNEEVGWQEYVKKYKTGWNDQKKERSRAWNNKTEVQRAEWAQNQAQRIRSQHTIPHYLRVKT